MRTEALSTEIILALIFGMAATNYALRSIPLVLLSRVKLPKAVTRWLSFVPISVMGALVASEVLVPDGTWVAPLGNPAFWAAAVSAITYRYTKSFIGGSMAGMVSFVVLRAMMG